MIKDPIETSRGDVGVFAGSMNAVMIYEDCEAGTKASAVLWRASWRAGTATPWSVKPWRLDMLESAALAKEAERDAAEAQLVVLALSRGAEVPAKLLDWLEGWAVHRQVQDAALALFDGSDGDTLSATATSVLREFAGRCGISFIFGAIEATELVPRDFWEQMHEREVAQTAVMADILGRVPPQPRPDWGINE